MPSRFYLPASGAAAASPTFSAEWEHQSGTRRPMSTTKSGTALAATTYTPDAADHIVDADALVVQFVSDRLAAQTIAAQAVTLVVQASEPDANNNLFLTWKLFIWTAAGAVGPTLLAIRRDATEVATVSTNRTDAATTTAVTIGEGDRLVLELGLAGLPTATGGVQGHNGSLRLGDAGATDATANDTGTATTENPWLEFANVLTLSAPPTSDPGAIRASARGAAIVTAGHLGQGIPRASGRGAAIVTAGHLGQAAIRAAIRAATIAVATTGELGAQPGSYGPAALRSVGRAAFETTPGLPLMPPLPPGWARTDILLLLLTHTGTGPFAAPAGWAQLAASTTGTTQRTELWWKRAAASESPPSVSLVDNAVSTVRGARIYAISGCPVDRSPFEGVVVQPNPTASTTVAVPTGSTLVGGELALLLVAYAADPLAASTMPGWTQSPGAVQGYSMDPWSGSATVASADPDVPSGGPGGNGAALIHEQRLLPTAGSVGAAPIVVSGGTFAPAASTSLLLTLVGAPTATFQVSIRALVASTRGGPALGRARASAVLVARKLTQQPAAALVALRTLAQTVRVGLTEAVVGLRATAVVETSKASSADAVVRIATSSVVDSQRSPTFFTPADGLRVRIRGQSTHISVLSPGPLPVRPPVPVDLGEIYRGDTVRLPVWAALARNGQPIDLTGCVLRFTAKLDLGLPDAEPTTINASSEDGSVAVLDPPSGGRYRVTIPAAETQGLEIDGSFTFDVQLQTAGAPRSVHTIQHGRLLVNRDVTRG